MSSNIYNHNSSVRDIGKLFPEEKRLGTKASDLVSGIALTACLDIDEAFDVLGTPPEQRVAILASTVFCADTPHGVVVKQAISGAIREYKKTVPLPEIPPPNIPGEILKSSLTGRLRSFTKAEFGNACSGVFYSKLVTP